MKFRKTIIGAILAAVISVSAIAPCNVVYAETSKTATAESAVPTNFKASKTTNSITLKWDEVEGADGYKVYMKNSATDEYEKYKNVTKNSCTITGLKKGTKYYFKVSVLTKNGEKYKEKANSKSKPVAVTTKTSSTTSEKKTTKKEIGEFSTPNCGDKKKTVLKNCGITNYEKDEEDNSYIGDVMYADIKSMMSVIFNEDDELYMWILDVPCSYSTGNYMVKSFKESFGYDYKYSDGRYVWQNFLEIVSIEYNYDYGFLIISYYDGTYADL